jgi:hypothetical protein
MVAVFGHIHLCLWGAALRSQAALVRVGGAAVLLSQAEWADVETYCLCAVLCCCGWVCGATCPQPVHLHGWGVGAGWIGIMWGFFAGPVSETAYNVCLVACIFNRRCTHTHLSACRA